MRRYTLLLVLAAALALGFVSSAPAQGPYLNGFIVTQAEPANVHVAAVSGDIKAIVKYIGDETSATVAVAAGGDITFQQAAAADTTLECPVSAPLGGIIDVSDAACDTMGEIADIVNASGDWRMVLIDSLRSDSSDNTIVTFTTEQATTADGIQLMNDGAVSFLTSVAVMPLEFRTSIKPYIDNRSGDFITDPFDGYQGLLFDANFTTTYGSGTSTLSVHSVKMKLADTSVETVTQLWSEAGGATTVLGDVDATAVGGMLGRKNEKLIVRVTNSAAQSAAVATTWGVMFRWR